MKNLLSILSLSVLIILIASLTSCGLIELKELKEKETFDISQLDESKITDFEIGEGEKVKYFRNIVLGMTSKTVTRYYSACSNDKILMSDKYIYLIENPGISKAFEYQLNIDACGTSAIRSTKTWKIAYDAITKVEYIYYTYIFYLTGPDTPGDTIFIKVHSFDKKLFKSILKEMGVEVIDVETFWVWHDTYQRKYLWKVNCRNLSKKWIEQDPTKSRITYSKIKHPAFWKEPECISKTGLWSKDGTKANTIHDANDKELLYTGSMDKGNNCGPYSASWVSTEEYEVDVCKDNWMSLDGNKKLLCENGMIIKLRRLAIGNDGCYPYGDLGDAYIDAFPKRIRGYE